jgi:hypothetical protein
LRACGFGGQDTLLLEKQLKFEYASLSLSTASKGKYVYVGALRTKLGRERDFKKSQGHRLEKE